MANTKKTDTERLLERLTVLFTKAQMKELRLRARQERKSVGQLIRESLGFS